MLEPEMDVSILSSVKNNFYDFVSLPSSFLQGDTSTSRDLRNQCKVLYDFCKESRTSLKPDPLPKLILENFDDEQVWGQIELFNKKEAALCLKAANVLLAESDEITLKGQATGDFAEEKSDHEDCMVESGSEVQDKEDENDLVLSEEEDGSEKDGFIFEESDEDEEVEQEDDGEEAMASNSMEQTEVDDEFFSLRQMEKFLEEEDRKNEMQLNKPTEGDIDYFEDIPSSDEADSAEGSSEDDKQFSSLHKSSRHVTYAEYFDEPQKAPNLASNTNNASSDLTKEIVNDNDMLDTDRSAFQKHQEQISKKIGVLEDKALTPADWQMKGEVKANLRPENSLLQEVLQFDRVTRPPTEITEEHTKTLEDVIKQRIIDEAWDDVKRKYKQQGDPVEYKKRIVIDSSQSKLTLGEIYEKEYLEKMQKVGKKGEDEKESEERTAIRKDMDDLFRKLDALSNFHFTALPPEPEIKLISNVPSIVREEVQPVTHADSQVLAPEEVFTKPSEEEKASEEKTSVDRKRERRRKKLRMKVRAKDRLEKMKKSNPNSKKVKNLEAVERLKKAAKAPGGNTTIVKETEKYGSKLTSQRFFSTLQDKGVQARDKRKR